MRFARKFDVVGVHCASEVADVVTGGVLDVPGKTMNPGVEPPCAPILLFLHATLLSTLVSLRWRMRKEYPPMSGANTICTTIVLLATGMVPMKEPVSKITLDTAAGLVTCTAVCDNGKCKSVAFDNVPAFVFELDYEVDVPDLGKVKVDIAWGGMIYAIVDAASVGLKITSAQGRKLVEVGERIKRAVQLAIQPTHPENPSIKGVSIVQFTEPIMQGELEVGQDKTAVNTVVVSPGRLDRSPCGTGTCARMVVLHARG